MQKIHKITIERESLFFKTSQYFHIEINDFLYIFKYVIYFGGGEVEREE